MCTRELGDAAEDGMAESIERLKNSRASIGEALDEDI